LEELFVAELFVDAVVVLEAEDFFFAVVVAFD